MRILALLLAASLGGQSAERPLDDLRVAGPVHFIRCNAKIGNPSITASIGPDGILLVDPGVSAVGPAVRRRLEELAGGTPRVRIVINTHSHGDHTEANELFGGEALVVARPDVRTRLATKGVLADDGRILPETGWPKLTFDEPFTLHFNGEQVEVIPMPVGHTSGDVVVYFAGSKVLAVGDYLFVDRFPVVDLDAGANLPGYLENLKALSERFPGDARVVPGHSTFAPQPIVVSTVADLKAYHAMLVESIEIVRGYMREGKSLEEAQKAGLPERFAKYETRPRYVPIARWIESVYRAYATER